jgi:hypothetical protein
VKGIRKLSGRDVAGVWDTWMEVGRRGTEAGRKFIEIVVVKGSRGWDVGVEIVVDVVSGSKRILRLSLRLTSLYCSGPHIPSISCSCSYPSLTNQLLLFSFRSRSNPTKPTGPVKPPPDTWDM